MLRNLHIRDFVIVERAEIDFGPGFTVFSGETGAGKSILVDALALTLGERADATVVREGAERADITAEFDPPEHLRAWLQERDLDDAHLLLRRVIDQKGRSRAYINGVPATVGQLRDLGDQLVDIHGQHAHQSLLRLDAQRDMLDEHGGLGELRARVAAAWKAWRTHVRHLEELETNASALELERERLQWQFDELDRLSLAAGEWEQLQLEHHRLAHGQTLIEGVTRTLAALDEADDNVHHRLASAVLLIQQLVKHDPNLKEVAEALESARISVSEAVSDLRSYADRLELDPQQLTEVEERIRAIFDAARKFRVQPESLPEYHKQLAEKLDELKHDFDIDALRAKEEEAAANYRDVAAELRAARAKTAKALAKSVTAAMQTLAMSGGRFEVVLRDTNPGPTGDQVVEFHVAGHKGSTPRPLAKVASGGELARISLALSVIASRAARVPTLIFDEVDSGVGGAVAEVVGRLLRELGSRHQVLCVTHLPQVAACGTAHFQVSKDIAGGRAVTRIRPLDAEQRVDELARLLGGIDITDTTRQHAREMLSIV